MKTIDLAIEANESDTIDFPGGVMQLANAVIEAERVMRTFPYVNVDPACRQLNDWLERHGNRSDEEEFEDDLN